MNDSHPRVSIIIPTYNSSRTLRATLESVVNQEFPDFEVRVVGDGCTDESAAVIRSLDDNRICWQNRPENWGGPSLPRREALADARGDFIAYLGHDDLWFPWHLSGLVACLQEHDADFAFSLGMLIGQNGVLGSFSLPEQVARSLSIVSPSNWLHRKELLERTGGWSPSLKYACDIDFLARMQAGGVRTVCHRRLSVLKYPAAEWRAYDQHAEPRQIHDLAAMKKDAEGLAGELLLDLAALVSRQKTYRSRSRVPLFIRVALARMVEIWGPHRWPLSAILRRRHRNRAGLGA